MASLTKCRFSVSNVTRFGYACQCKQKKKRGIGYLQICNSPQVWKKMYIWMGDCSVKGLIKYSRSLQIRHHRNMPSSDLHWHVYPKYNRSFETNALFLFHFLCVVCVIWKVESRSDIQISTKVKSGANSAKECSSSSLFWYWRFV